MRGMVGLVKGQGHRPTEVRQTDFTYGDYDVFPPLPTPVFPRSPGRALSWFRNLATVFTFYRKMHSPSVYLPLSWR